MEFGPVIKNPVLDINKLVRQGTMLNQSVQNVEGDSTADQATTDLLAKKDPVIHEIAVGMSGEELTQYTVSGAPPLSLPNSLGKPLKAWEVDVLPYQEGTGDPSPSNVRPIHGTNKLNLFVEESYDQSATPKAVIDAPILSANQWDEEWEKGFISWTGTNVGGDRVRTKGYIPVVPNTEYYVKSDNSNIQIFYYNEQKEFVSYQPSSVRNQTVTIPSGCYYMRWYTYTESYGTTYNHDIAINYPSTVTAYNPFNNTVYTGTIGSEGGESRWISVDLSTLTWQTTANRAISENLNGIVKPPTATSTVSGSYAEQYTEVRASGTLTNGTYAFLIQNNIVKLFFFYDGVNMPTGKLVFPLLNPQTLPLTAPTIPTPTGTATTWATAEDGTVDGMEVTYVGKA